MTGDQAVSRPSLARIASPYCRHGQIPEKSAARSGEAFEEGPRQADAREGLAAGFLADGTVARRPAQSGDRQGHRRRRRADRPRAQTRTTEVRDERDSAAAGQFLRPPRGFFRRAPGAQIDQGFRRGAAVGLRGEEAERAGRRSTPSSPKRSATACRATRTWTRTRRRPASPPPPRRWNNCCARAARNLTIRPARSGRRTARPVRRSRKAARSSSSSPTSSPRATSR